MVYLSWRCESQKLTKWVRLLPSNFSQYPHLKCAMNAQHPNCLHSTQPNEMVSLDPTSSAWRNYNSTGTTASAIPAIITKQDSQFPNHKLTQLPLYFPLQPYKTFWILHSVWTDQMTQMITCLSQCQLLLKQCMEQGLKKVMMMRAHWLLLFEVLISKVSQLKPSWISRTWNWLRDFSLRILSLLWHLQKAKGRQKTPSHQRQDHQSGQRKMLNRCQMRILNRDFEW